MQKNDAHFLCANAVRVLATSAIEKARSGHPGVVLGFADVLTVLWRQHIRYDLGHPQWQNRDRFVLSNGHASALYYAILHCCGFDISMDDMQQFRQLDSRTPGHPERDIQLGIDVATGPLGQGLANAVGMAFSEYFERSKHDDQDLVDFFTYAAVGDGCLMEGISHEACSLAGRYGLGKLIVCWDDNGISIDGRVDGWAERSVVDRFKSYGWQVIESIDGHDPQAIDLAFLEAKSCLDRPSLLCFKTIIGHQTDLAGDCQSHGKPLGKARFNALKDSLSWVADDFDMPELVYSLWQSNYQAGRFDAWVLRYQETCGQMPSRWGGGDLQSSSLPEDWQGWWRQRLSSDKDFVTESRASRHSSQMVLQQLVDYFPGLIGGSADLAESTGVLLSADNDWIPGGRPGSFIHFGVREFAMFAIANGLSTCMGLRPFVSTFLVFSDYGLNAIRMAALMKLPVIFIFSHDSVFVGEDGPTHQPIEQLSHLRSIPNLETWRPADAFETAIAWKQILSRTDGPCCLVLSRQKLPSLGNVDNRWGCEQGMCRLDDYGDQCSGVLISSGSEVGLAVAAQKKLEDLGLRVGVLSVLSMERLCSAEPALQKQMLTERGFRLVIEAGASQCWYQLLSGHGIIGEVIGIDQFGRSGAGEAIYEASHFHVDTVCQKAFRLYNILALQAGAVHS